ncbi:MAG: tetratricopeptide repeat protein [Bacteroidales bacterium]
MRIFLLFLLMVFNSANLFSQQPHEASANERLADQYMREGQFDKAVVLYEELFNNHPTPVIYNNYLESLLQLGEFRKAERVVQRQQQNNPGRVRFEVDMGYVYDRSGDQRKTRRHFEGLIRNLPAFPMAVTDLANAFLFRDYTDWALQAYQRGRAMFGNAHPLHVEIASIYSKTGRFDLMMEEYVNLIAFDDSFLEQVQGLMQDELNNDPEFTKSDALRRLLLQRSQQNNAPAIFSELLLWLSLQQKDFAMAFRQARVLDRRLGQDGQLVMEVAHLSTSNNELETALQAYQWVVDRGNLNPFWLEARVGLLNVKYLQATTGYSINYSMLREVEREYTKTIEELGIRVQTVSLMRNLAHLRAFYLNNTEGASELLQAIIDMQGVANRVKGECRIELADILLLQGDLWDAHLLYAQVDKTFRDDPLGHEARFKNARLSFYMGEFNWAKAQLDVLKAATSRLIANDAMALSLLIQDHLEQDGTSVPLQMFARAQLHTFRHNFEQALQVLDSVQQRFPSHKLGENVLMESARIHIRTGNYTAADDLLASLVVRFPSGLLAADATFERAMLHERIFNNKAMAMELYQQILVDYPGSLRAASARNRFRYLRGDLSIEQLFFHGL